MAIVSLGVAPHGITLEKGTDVNFTLYIHDTKAGTINL